VWLCLESFFLCGIQTQVRSDPTLLWSSLSFEQCGYLLRASSIFRGAVCVCVCVCVVVVVVEYLFL
jgi:hypothetical protein